MIGEAQGAENVAALLPFELPGAEYLGIAEPETMKLDREAGLKIANENLLINGVAVRKGVAVQKDISQDSPSL